MDQKVRTYIDKVTVNERTYHNLSFEPTLINFFFGKNGSGKSTIARAIRSKKPLSWHPGSSSDAVLMVYNEDYIRDNIQSYGNIPGVFTMSEVNARIKKEVDEKTKERSDARIQQKSAEEAGVALKERHDTLDDRHAAKVWNKTEQWRKTDFPATQSGYTTNKKKFFLALHQYKPVQADPKELIELYQTVFTTEEPPRYDPYATIDYQCLPSPPEILAKPIISRADTDFARFFRGLGNLDWVRHGHEKYMQAADGKCPFCQQPMPFSFTEDLEACYDDKYREELDALKAFVKQYKDTLNRLYVVLTNNQKNPFPVSENWKEAYQYEFDMFMEKAKNNVNLLDQKLSQPSSEIGYEFEDLSPYLHKVSDCIAAINEEIAKYMHLITDPKQKKECSARVWSFMAYECRDLFEAYEAEKKELETNLSANEATVNGLKTQIRELTKRIGELNKSTVNTTKVMEDINATLRSIGFKGFYLREKPGASYVYELVREENGTIEIAKDLSEGERNFIAFLYFYHTVMGSQSDDGRVDDKIVVIDDPVSSMDQQTLFYVSALVREMIAVCYNNFEMDEEKGADEHIRQFFCLTHNPVFFRDITYNRISQYECVTFFEITKDKDNHSHIGECWEEISATGGGYRINKSPVRNYYDSLWHELRTTDSPEMLMSVARQILEFFFLQTGGYKSAKLRDLLFEGDNKREFERQLADGSTDRTYYNIATSMIALLDVGVTNFNDGLFFDSSAFSVEQMKDAFAIIFEVMRQPQHYKLVIGIQD